MIVVILYALVVIISLLLIGLILIQPSKGGGGAGAVLGGVGESVFGAQAGSHLTKATVFLTAVFFALTLGLAAYVGWGINKTDGLGGVDATLREEASKSVLSTEAVLEAKDEAPAVVEE